MVRIDGAKTNDLRCVVNAMRIAAGNAQVRDSISRRRSPECQPECDEDRKEEDREGEDEVSSFHDRSPIRLGRFLTGGKEERPLLAIVEAETDDLPAFVDV